MLQQIKTSLVDKSFLAYTTGTLILGLVIYSFKQLSRQSKTENEKKPESEEEKLNSENQSQRSKVSQTNSKPKNPTQKKKQLQQKINTIVKRQFQTDIEGDSPETKKQRCKLQKQPSSQVSERSQSDRIFFQIYEKITKEESGEDS